MRPPSWHPPIALSAAEQALVARIRRAKLFVFLRRVHHELFSDPFQAELAGIFRESLKGQPPLQGGVVRLPLPSKVRWDILIRIPIPIRPHHPDLFTAELLAEPLEDADLIRQAIDPRLALLILLHDRRG